MLWNIRTNELYKVSVDKAIQHKFVNQVYNIITKQTNKVVAKKTVNKPTSNQNHSYKIGELIEHNRFGVGCITKIKNIQQGELLVIQFDDYGEKAILADYVLPFGA